MAIEYTYYLKTEYNPKQLLELLINSMGIETSVNSVNNNGVFSFSKDAFIVSAFSTQKDTRSFIFEDYGVDSEVTIIIRLDKEKRENQKQQMLQLVIELLEKVNGDALFLFNGEEVLFICKNTKLIINSEADFWTPIFLGMITLPYILEKMSIL